MTAAASRAAAAPAPVLLLDRHPLRAIVALAAPTTAVMLIAAVSNIFHTYFVGWLGDEAIAAVSLVFPIALVLNTVVAGGLGAGVASGIARALGAAQPADARGIAEHAFLIAALLALLGTGATELGAHVLFGAMGGRGAVLEQAVVFARVLFGGLLITFTASTFDSILRGSGNMRVPAVCGTLSLVLQIVFTPLLMFQAGLGLIGAPLATLTGQLIGLLPRFVYVFGGWAAIRPRLLPRRVYAGYLREILRVGIPASLSASFHYLALMVLTGTVARFGFHYLAAYGLGTRLDFVLFTIGFGVAAAAMTLVGMATGAGRRELVARYVAHAAALAAGLIAVPVALVIWRPSLWLGLYSATPEITAIGATYFHIVGPSYLFVVVSMVVASAFQAIGRAVVPLTVTVARVVLVVGAALVAARGLGLGAAAIFAVISAGNIVSCLALVALFRVVAGARRSRRG